jgi:hypothetical protein
MKAVIIFFVLGVWGTVIIAQERVRNYFPVSTLHTANAKINGVSIGLITGLNERQVNVTTNGLRLELVGLGIFLPLISKSPISEGDRLIRSSEIRFTEKINGISISATGMAYADCLVNGIAIGGLGQYSYANNGIITSLVMTVVKRQNGLQLSLFNEGNVMNGIQIGLSNSLVYSNGIQMGVLNNSFRRTRGIQIGIFNNSKDLNGLQIGVWNVNNKRKMPFINWNFKN